jgi:polysaccharide biosynthesis protein PelE
MMAVGKQLLVAIGTEMAAFALLGNSHASGVLLAYFGLHAMASVLVSSIAWRLLPVHLRQPWWSVLALLFSFAFFIPGLGVISMVLVIHVALRYPSVVGAEQYVEIKEPQFHSNEKEKREQSDIRISQARRILHDPAQSVETKLRVLIALQHMRPKVAIPLLQGLLADRAEDIRLLAYSMMDAWEKDITVRLQSAQTQLDAAVALGSATTDSRHDAGFDKIAHINAHRKLAELYWEQVDTGLARGDLRTFALQKAKTHCEESLGLDGLMAGVWRLYGLVLIELHQLEGARRAMELARKAGMSDVQVMPHLARIAFDEGRYNEVRKCMKRLSKRKNLPHNLRQVVRYWTGHKMVDIPL